MKGLCLQVVYILDQVRALENEMLLRIQKQGLDFTPRILIVSVTSWVSFYICGRVVLSLIVFSVHNKLKFSAILKVTRLIPDARGTTCNQRLERVSGTEHTHILRVPFRSDKGTLRKWISRFDVYPYLETYAEVNV